MRFIVLLSVMLLTLGGGQPPVSGETATPSPTKLDHILLWGRSIDEVTAVLAVKLGFQIRPGHDPGGVANRYVRFSDRGYLELLGITRPNPDMDPGMRADQASLHGAAGSRSFGIYSSALDQVRTALLDNSFAVTPVFTAPTANPDGGGPLKSSPPDWRLFAFEHSPLSSNFFFIDYAPSYAMQTSAADDQIVRTHPNSARELSAFWLLSSDAESDRRQLTRMGFDGGRPVHIPRISARGHCVPVGPTYIIALELDGPGVSADALSKGGPRVLGVSIAVTDLDRAQRWVERGYQQQLKRYDGALGVSFLAPNARRSGIARRISFIGPPSHTSRLQRS
ncbi:MAG: hypothetical protein QOJ42_804 [Acidobacteriaceae bacterium]|nr:hypothetical protein [Acidobacteriaceae bacterium]